ncbi:methyltransferase domain-containing protein [Zavarzinia sp. CC-PAN008]|uniref:methyltransferase domain-containing protein n=1 Tax=Zavarzinia sp. CC-PAN008 TaxID=3243332 RepID=UPI003F746CE7
MSPLPEPARAPEADVFASGAYWAEYYSSLGHENREAARFLHASTRIPVGQGGAPRVLDAGCGPTLLYWGVFYPDDARLSGFDLNPSGVAFTQRCVADAKAGRFDPGILDAAGFATALDGRGETAQARMAATAARVERVDLGDLTRTWPAATASTEFVTSCFAFECINSWEGFRKACAEAARVLVPGGRFVLVMTGGIQWVCDGQTFPTLFATERRVREALLAAPFKLEALQNVESQDVAVREQGYDSMLLIRALRLPEPV